MVTVEQILMKKGPDVVVADGSSTVYEAAKMMAQANVGAVVIKSGEEVAGIFTERDLLRKVVAHNRPPAETPLDDVMTSPVFSVALSDTADTCARLLEDKHIRHLVVVEQGALVGMISFRDVLYAQAAA